MNKFIYVFSTEDRDTLSTNGYNLLKADNRNNIYIFENSCEVDFDFSTIKYVDSNILTF